MRIVPERSLYTPRADMYLAKDVEFIITKRNTPLALWLVGCFYGEPGGDLLSHTGSALSSARFRFTVLFGKGRGGSETLWPPSITCSFVAWCGERKTGRRGLLVVIVYELRCS